jgi:splicing factor 45
LSAQVEDEYVPSMPNSYEELAARRAERRHREEAETLREARRLVLEGQRAALFASRSGNDSRNRSELDVTGEEAFTRRAKLGGKRRDAFMIRGVGDGGLAGSANSPDALAGGGESLALKMMKKMGYKEGRGLGKNDQGMKTPLEVKKDSARSGIIRNAPEKPLGA